MNAIPLGFCQCGCGQRTNLAPKNRAKYGWVKGQPLRYVKSHHGNGIGREFRSVDVEPLRTAFLRSGLTASEIARRLGWYWDGQPDSTRVKRRLGLASFASNGMKHFSTTIHYRVAVQIAEALNVDPHQVGV